MILKEIIPINFGPFAIDTKLIVEPEVTVLTGPNDSGKSSLLRLIRIIYGSEAADERDYNQYRHGAYSQAWQNDPEFGCTATFQSTSESLSLFSMGGQVAVGDLISVKFSITAGNIRRTVVNIRRNGASVSFPGGLGINKMPQVIYLPMQDEVRDTIDLTKMNRAETTLVKLGFGENFTFENFQSFQEHRRAVQVGSAQTKLNRILEKVLPQSMGMRFHLREVGDKPYLLTISLVDRHNGFSSVGSRGTGVRKILGVMGTLLTIEKKQHTCILYDEPETSLHADSQHLLRRILEELGREPKVQVLYVTHSPSMINTMRPGIIRLLSRTERDERATSIIENAAFDNNYIGVRSSLGITASDSLLYAPITVVVEGPTEVRCLPLVLEKLRDGGVPGFEDLDLVLSHAHFLEGTGDSYEKLYKVAKSQNVGTVLFLDGDKQTKLIAFRRDNADVAIILLPGTSEFEEIIPHADYIRALAYFLAETTGHSTQDFTEENFDVWAVSQNKRLAFSKQIERWVDDVTEQGKQYRKPLVMQKAVEATGVDLIDPKPFQELMKAMKNLLPTA